MTEAPGALPAGASRMSSFAFLLDCLRDPRLSGHAASGRAAWLWSPDGAQVLWATAEGAAVLGARNAAQLAARRFGDADPLRQQIARLAGTLPHDAAPRLERLRGLGAMGRPLTCACTRIALKDKTSAVLVAATERAGPALTLRERLHRLLAGLAQPVAVFAADGRLLYADEDAKGLLSGATTLAGLGAQEHAAAALRDGHADCLVDGTSLVLDRIGEKSAPLLTAVFAPAAQAEPSAAAPEPPAPMAESEAAAASAPPTAAEPGPEVKAEPSEAALPPAIVAETETIAAVSAEQEPTTETTAASAAEQEPPTALAEEDAPSSPAPIAPGESDAGAAPEAGGHAPVAATAEEAHPSVEPDVAAPPEPQDAIAPPDRPVEAGPDASGGTEIPGAPTEEQVRATTPIERRHPLRFVWQIDTNGAFTVDSDEFVHLVGRDASAGLGRPWRELAAALELDPTGAVAKAVASQETWSGITVAWPVEGSEERLAVELSGLPVFDRERVFRGYRGFGVCRDTARLAALAQLRESTPTAAEAAPAVERAEAPAPAAGAEERPVLTVVPQARNVVPFRPTSGEGRTPSLSPVERKAFRELARQLSARLGSSAGEKNAAAPQASAETQDAAETGAAEAGIPAAEADQQDRDRDAEDRQARARRGQACETAAARGGDAGAFGGVGLASKPDAEAGSARAILDHVPTGVLIYRLDQLLYANRAFLTWTGYDRLDALAAAGGLDSLFVEPSPDGEDSGRGRALSITSGGGSSMAVEARLFSVSWEGEQALMLMIAPPAPAPRDEPTAQAALADARARIAELEADLTQWKKTEEELINAKRQAERASAAKSEFLATISHEIRTPLNAIIGFAEVMMEQRFGPIGNERYRGYLGDIRTSGAHLISLLNDLLDLSKIEAGKLELTFDSFNLNELIQQCVAIMQAQANRERIIIRTSLSPKLPLICADARSVRQIVLNLLSNSIKFTHAGGQLIVSTALTEAGEVALRVRDTGIGMSEAEIAAALEPFRQIAAARPGVAGSGLGLPLAKALAEANQASFHITSAANAGTLVEVAFPPRSVMADMGLPTMSK